MRCVGREALDGGDLGALDGAERRAARAHRLAVDMHGARAAKRRAAAEFGAGELQLIADHPQERGAVLGGRRNRFAVKSERDHRNLLCRGIFTDWIALSNRGLRNRRVAKPPTRRREYSRGVKTYPLACMQLSPRCPCCKRWSALISTKVGTAGPAGPVRTSLAVV